MSGLLRRYVFLEIYLRCYVFFSFIVYISYSYDANAFSSVLLVLTIFQAGYLLSAKALVNFTLLAIIVPRIIRHASTTTSSPLAAPVVHRAPPPPSSEKEIRINIMGAEISILISVFGVLCIALAFKFWMLLAGESSYLTSSHPQLNEMVVVTYA